MDVLILTSKNQIKVDLVDENFTELKGEIAGPPDTPYEDFSTIFILYRCVGLCILSLQHMMFGFLIERCTVIQGGDVLLLVKEKSDEGLYLLTLCRAAAMTLRTVLLSLQALLAAAEPDDPQDAVVANQYKQNPEMFKQTARLWSHVYAGAPVSSPEYTRKIDKLCAMGFDKNAVIVALSSKSWDVETATELLLSN
ncbi:Ubiquitin-conjugating enzyme E2 K [Bagarius yarrelli]|uniref:Ubiquitin-conjugating enzyme E2 K n=1 Tax=Bagarius yarrelli TaxID=175774 RepID=A0A556UFZ2_BAGYA|nr:Ubiquitin-conjugating enzyme E2 K [Bagarius yarrelli]